MTQAMAERGPGTTPLRSDRSQRAPDRAPFGFGDGIPRGHQPTNWMDPAEYSEADD